MRKKHNRKERNNKLDAVNYSTKNNAYYPTKEWLTSKPEQQGLDSTAIAEAFRSFRDRNVISIVIIRNGYLVSEVYKDHLDENTPQDVRSITKSITSTLTGIALSENKLRSVDQRISEWFPSLASDPLKGQIMIKHLLNMTSGLEWDDQDDKSSKNMMYSSYWIENILGHSSLYQSGTKYNYSNGDAHLLSGVLQKALGQSLFEYAQSRLFAPLGITNVKWAFDPQGHSIGAWGMALTARDMAKLGLLYLREGMWEGKPLVSKQWIRESLTKRVWLNYSDGRQGGYGYYWWLKPLEQGLIKEDNKMYDYFYAAGSWGQRIFVVPGLQLIVAMTANSSDVEMPEQLLNSVVTAIRSHIALPENPKAYDRLQQTIESFKMAAVL